MEKANNKKLVRHLLSRAGFGFTPEEYEEALKYDYEELVDRLVDFEKVDNSALETAIKSQQFDFTNPDDIRRWWLFRMLFTARPLEEKMTLFWHGHFATSIKKVRNPYAMYQQNSLFRRLCLGRFDELLLSVSRDPSMILYLDNQQNRKGKPNENYAREVMELFTMGIGNYSETDVKEAARAFTGWHTKQGKFYFDKGAHDEKAKTVLSVTGNLDGGDIVTILAKRKQTSQRLALKLIKFFLTDEPDKTLLNKVARAYEPEHKIAPMVKEIFLSSTFRHEGSYHGLVKSPCEYVIGALKTLQLSTVDGDTFRYLASMGQDLFAPPSVKGWDGGTAWLSSDTMMGRFNYANRIVAQKFDAMGGASGLRKVCQSQNLQNGEDMVDYFLTLFVDGDVPKTTRQSLLDYVQGGSKGGERELVDFSDRALDAKLRGLIHLIICLPTYQLS